MKLLSAVPAADRDVAHALRTLRCEELPPDFARKVAAAALRQEKLLYVFEYAMLLALCVVFAVTLAGVGVWALNDVAAPGGHCLYVVLIVVAAAGAGIGRTARIA